MELKMYQVDAFADKLFSGNPAAVVILESSLKDDVMQSIATENNLSETAVSDKLFSVAIDCMTSSLSDDSRITTAAGLPENNLSAKAST